MTDFSYQYTGIPNHPVILFLHGFLGDHTDWTEVSLPLQNSFQCLMLDLPGHGQTSLPDHSYALKPCARHVISLLDDLHISRCHLVGYSLGGRLGLYLALQFPDYFNCIVLESSSPGLKTEAEREQRRSQDELTARQLDTMTNMDMFLAQWYTQPLFSTIKQNPDRFQMLLGKRRHHNPANLAKSLRLMGTGVQSSLWDELTNLNQQVLLIVGEHDPKFCAIASEMHTRLPHAALEIIKNAGHNTHFEQPDTFVKTLQSFLSSRKSL